METNFLDTHLLAEDDERGIFAEVQPSGPVALLAEEEELGALVGIQPSGQFVYAGLPPGLSEPMWVYNDSEEHPTLAGVGGQTVDVGDDLLVPASVGSASQAGSGGARARSMGRQASGRFSRRLIQSLLVILVLVGGLLLAISRVQSAQGARGNASVSTPVQSRLHSVPTSPPLPTTPPLSSLTGTPEPGATARPTGTASPTDMPTPTPLPTGTLSPGLPRYSFEDGALDGWSAVGDVSILTNSQEIKGQNGSHELGAVFFSTDNSDWPYIRVKPAQGPSAGQTLTAYVYVPTGNSTTVKAKLFVEDSTHTWHLENADGVTLSQGSWIKLSFHLSGYSGKAVELGVQCFEAPANIYASLFIDSVNWS